MDVVWEQVHEVRGYVGLNKDHVSLNIGHVNVYQGQVSLVWESAGRVPKRETESSGLVLAG